MSLPTERQAFAFLEPLRSKSAIITVKDRSAKIPVSRFVLGCLASSRTYTAVFDGSAFFATNIQSLAHKLPKAFLQRCSIIVPSEESRMEEQLSEIMSVDAQAFLIDDLNALLYLTSPRGERSGLHRLSNFFHLLAYSARSNKSFAIGTVYKNESGTQSTRSLASISDLEMTAEVKDSELSFRCSGIGWPSSRFNVPFYLDPRT